MITSESRYAGRPIANIEGPEGETIRYIVPIPLPPAAAYMVGLKHRTTDSDRVDNLSFRHFGLPGSWHLIANASDVMHPDQLLSVPGKSVSIPVPGIEDPAK